MASPATTGPATEGPNIVSPTTVSPAPLRVYDQVLMESDM